MHALDSTTRGDRPPHRTARPIDPAVEAGPAADHPSIGRRDLLRVGAAGVFALGSVGAVPRASAEGGDADPETFAAWFEGVENYDGVVDATGRSTVRVEVGATGNGGGFAFGPAAVRVDPGTTVVWEWTGEGGLHNVVAEDGAFESELLGDAGDTFEHAFDAEGVAYYVCTPHRAMGMRGAVVVGDLLVGGGSGGEAGHAAPHYGDWFEGVENFRGTVDATGMTEVRVQVGAPGNGGDYAFEPAAVRVDPGTRVVWEWTGAGGTHEVVALDGQFASDPATEAGTTFAVEVAGDGIAKYSCPAHLDRGMRGAIVVGAGGTTETTLTPLGMAAVGGLGLLVGVPFIYALAVHVAETTGQARVAAEKAARRKGRPG